MIGTYSTRDDSFTYETISMTMTRAELIDEVAEKTSASKAKLITKTTDALAHMLADHYASIPSETEEVLPEANAKPAARAKKTTRVCKICGCEKPLAEYGPTHKQVACKGECLKEYTRNAIARAKARANAAAAEAERLERVRALGAALAVDSFVGPKVLFAADERVLLTA
jgi:hypothetical protein